MARKKKLDAVERQKSFLKRSLDDLKRGYIRPNPTRLFKVGDEIRYGNWDWSAILEVCENGLYYKVFSVTKRVEYGVDKGAKFKIHYLEWHNCHTIKDTSNEMRFTSKYNIQLNFHQSSIESLLGYYYRFGIDLNPVYQRGNVWTEEQKHILLNSIFDHVDIGKFALIRRPYSYNGELHEMLDGKQRFSVIIDFFEDRLEYHGLKFSDLHPMDKFHFKNYAISLGIAENLTEEDKLRYFLHLNTNGSPIEENHIENVENMLEVLTKN